jgi:16S rRNA (cytosine967-C5)-methyltransferase
VRRDPDIRWHRHERDLAAFAGDQLALLMRAADVVRPGGRLVYATCSSEPEENDGVVARFVATRPDFRIGNLHNHARAVIAPFIDVQGFFRTTPPAHGLEAFYTALLIRS